MHCSCVKAFIIQKYLLYKNVINGSKLVRNGQISRQVGDKISHGDSSEMYEDDPVDSTFSFVPLKPQIRCLCFTNTSRSWIFFFFFSPSPWSLGKQNLICDSTLNLQWKKKIEKWKNNVCMRKKKKVGQAWTKLKPHGKTSRFITPVVEVSTFHSTLEDKPVV